MRAQLNRFSVYSVCRIRLAWLCITAASLLASVLMQSAVHAAQVTLRWDYSASGASGFVLYCGPSSHNYPTRIDVGNTDTYTIGTLTVGATSFCTVTAYDSAKVESAYSNELSVYVPPAAPTVNFSASPASGTAPLTVAFTNTTAGQVTSWAWNFGDGTTSTAQNPTHVYSTPGSYAAVLTASGPGGTVSKTAATAISVVGSAAPVVNFSASPASGTAPVTVAFTNTTTGQVTSWAWNFGDGTTGIVKNPTHVYSTPGSYKATLTATGPGGTVSKTAATAVIVTGTTDGTVPTVGIAAPSNGTTVAGMTTVSANASDNVGVVGVQFLLDGAALGSEQTGPSFSLPWSTNAVSNGVHSLSARARDAAGNTALAATVSVTVSNAQPAGLVAAYNFDAGTGATVADASGKGNTGTIKGATWTTQGRFGGALSFNGLSSMVQMPSSPSLNLSSAMTLEAWIFPTASQSGWRAIVTRDVDAYFLFASNKNGTLLPAGGGTFNGTVAWVGGPAASPVNAWTHTALTYDGATLRLYVNGVQVASQARTGGIQTNANPLSIGGNSAYGEFFQGRIDEVRVYNRALSQAQIQTDMNSPVAPSVAVDTTPPSTPAGLTAAAVRFAQVNLAWAASSDNVAVTGYRIERCQGAGCSNFTVQVATPTGTSLNDSGVAAATSYSYRVRAIDAAGNLSGYSNVVSVTTLTAAKAGLVAAYGFNEGSGTTLSDASGNGNAGAIKGAAWTTQGRFGGALSFNGLSSMVQMPSSTALNLTSAMTLEAWIFPTASQSGWRAIVTRDVDAYFLYASNKNGTLLPAGGGTFNGTVAWVGGPTASPVNAWTHTALTYDGATLRLYVNGVQVASQARTGGIQTNASPLSIGGNSAYGEFFQGHIDEVRVYSRALSQAEIQADMNTAVSP